MRTQLLSALFIAAINAVKQGEEGGITEGPAAPVEKKLKDKKFNNGTNDGTMPDDWNKDSDTDNYQFYDFTFDENWEWLTDAEMGDISNKWWNNWLTDNFKQTFNLRRKEVWDAQIEKATEKYGDLLATCQAGIDCQQNVKN